MTKPITFATTTLALLTSASLAAAEVDQPQEIIMRPLTTPGSQLTVGGDLGFDFEPETEIGLGVLGRYGVSDQLEVGAGYGFALQELEAKGDLTVEGAFNLLEGNLAVSAQAELGFSILDEVLLPLQAGARVRFRLNDQMAVYSPGNQLFVTLDGEEVEIPPADPVTFAPMYLHAPVGFAYQASANLYAWAQTDLAIIEIQDADSGVIFADFVPLALGAFFSPSNTLDLGGALDLGDLTADDFDWKLIASARLHM